jgi:DNA-binding XRE family transcriptional regulator
MDRNSLKNELQNTLQSKLSELRNGLGLSQEGFAELIGKSRQAVSLFKRGNLKLSWKACLAILGVTINRDKNVLANIYGDAFLKDFQHEIQK